MQRDTFIDANTDECVRSKCDEDHGYFAARRITVLRQSVCVKTDLSLFTPLRHSSPSPCSEVGLPDPRWPLPIRKALTLPF